MVADVGAAAIEIAGEAFAEGVAAGEAAVGDHAECASAAEVAELRAEVARLRDAAAVAAVAAAVAVEVAVEASGEGSGEDVSDEPGGGDVADEGSGEPMPPPRREAPAETGGGEKPAEKPAGSGYGNPGWRKGWG